MPGPADELLATFLDEAGEHLATLEGGFLRARDGVADPEQMNALFRSAHSIKGGSGLFGFEPITRLTHALEQLLDRMRKGQLTVTGDRVDLMLRAVDGLSGLLVSARAGLPFAPPDETLRELSIAAGLTEHDSPTVVMSPLPARSQFPYQLELLPGPHLLTNGIDPLLLLRNLSKKGDLREVTPSFDDLPGLDRLDPELCYLSWKMTIETEVTIDDLRDVFLFVQDDCTVRITPLTKSAPSLGEAIPQFGQAIESLIAWVTDSLPSLRRAVQ